MNVHPVPRIAGALLFRPTPHVDERGFFCRTKRQLATGISNAQVDHAVDRALEVGATGAKLTGAGGGGFLLVVCPVERQRAVRESLADMNELPVARDRLGSRIVLNVQRHLGLTAG
jgi:galactokinase/mevalonate kinase-like predicted kinase